VPLPEGGQRLVYSQQPAGQQVYHMDFDARHKLVRVEQVLDTAHFSRCAMAWIPVTMSTACSARPP
jgi:hypothetical protein